MKSIKLAAILVTVVAGTLPAMAGEQALHSSIQVPFAKGTPDAQEESNTPRLFKLAKITKQQAKTVAASRFHGKFGSVDLENEDGNLIWSVEIGKHELAIDAGNGKVLNVE